MIQFIINLAGRFSTPRQSRFKHVTDRSANPQQVRHQRVDLLSNYNSHDTQDRTTEANMAAIGRFLKNAWNKEPVITVSCGIAFLALLLPALSLLTKYSVMMNSVVPYSYPVPVRDDGNMPDVPAHPSDPQGKNIDWLKNL
ncbi:NADH dehydrogenase [ubiquinone] 1 alpha subcomplex subunit 3 [Puntigrus tetrazona]|uniref:NADH dehydrogenase [ubiquinone] 1 alpha subcomplex subunit 3 n=1 Tax=Puntigrus tetrazona TaxID=1606681 RepID=UPI001C8AA874|nr:NADH dehydrogenase [ubiquinone] 1 alpha subcomplex subunit 3 [Puntigrus tetrazona]